MPSSSPWKSRKTGIFLIAAQVLFLILFGVFVEYGEESDASVAHASHLGWTGEGQATRSVDHYYGSFQDVHVMIFVGFGFLMTFLKRYCYSAVSFNLLLGALVIQWATLINGWLHTSSDTATVRLHITDMLSADFACAAILITFGAVLGKLSPLQLSVMAMIETAIFALNEWIGIHLFKAVDIGGSMFVHVFGAYFGLGLSRAMWHKGIDEEEHKEGSDYRSDAFSMIGTLFLWLFWPSFNSALAPGDDQQRAIINTYLALCSCTVVTFALSTLTNKDENKYVMEHVQNSTLAGGVAVGTCADMMIHPVGALIIGAIAGTVSVLGFKYIKPFLHKRLKVHDTCGVNNLHGMPGVVAGICGTIAALVATEGQYRASLYQVFPARSPPDNSSELLLLRKPGEDGLPGLEGGDGRSAGSQAGFQFAALALTVVVAVVTGVMTGLVLRLEIFDPPDTRSLFEDTQYWELPQEEDEFDEHGHPSIAGAKSTPEQPPGPVQGVSLQIDDSKV